MRRSMLTVMALALLALVGVGAGTWYMLPTIARRPPVVPASQLPTAPAAPAILLQQSDGNIAIVDSAGTVKPLTGDANGAGHIYTFAVPAPDGSRIAFVETVHGSTAVTSSVVVQQLGGTRQIVFGSQDVHPFYLHWSPDSHEIAFLSSASNDMLLQTVGIDGRPAHQITAGQPSYFAWTPDSLHLLLHTRGEAPTGSLSIWSVGDAHPTPLKPAPAFFRAPVWLPDGQSALVTIQEAGDVVLARVTASGGVAQRLAHSTAGMVFVLAPDGRQVAYIDMARDVPSVLHVVGSDGHGDHVVSKQDAISFWWSPSGDQIAYLTVANGNDPQSDGSSADRAAPAPVVSRQQQQPTLHLRWNIYNLLASTSRSFQSFVPTTEFLSLLPFFDQYAQSIRLWDRPGRHLLYADSAGVWSLTGATGTTTKAADGVLGIWMDP